MQLPVLTYDGEKMLLEFPGWHPKAMDAIREDFICWRLRPKSGNILEAEPILLAMREAKEKLPHLQVDADTKDLLRAIVNDRVEPLHKIDTSHLYDVQVTPTNRLWNMERALVTAAPGLGKTVIALTALRNLSFSLVVVVVPLTSFDGWVEEIRRWLLPWVEESYPDYNFYRWRERREVVVLEEVALPTIVLTTPNVLGTMTNLESEYGQGISAVFYDASHAESFLILDESFMYQNRKALRTNLMDELAGNFRTIWLLSGMPVGKVNDDLYTQLKLLHPRIFRSYWKFVRRYCLLETNHWGTKIVGNYPGSEDKLRQDLEDIIISCDYPPDIPEWIPIEVACPMTSIQEQYYREAKANLLTNVKTLRRDEPLTIKSLLTLTGDLLQIASNPVLVGGEDSSGKWDKLIEMLHTGELPVLIWVKYIKTAKLLRQRLEECDVLWRIGTLTGATKPVDRFRLVTKFQEGNLDILLLNDVVGKYSLTLTAAKIAYYLERDYNGEAYYQSLYRSRRITSKHGVKIVHLMSTTADGKSTVDAVVHTVLRERSQSAQLLTIGKLIGAI